MVTCQCSETSWQIEILNSQHRSLQLRSFYNLDKGSQEGTLRKNRRISNTDPKYPKILEVTFDKLLTFTKHVEDITARVKSLNKILKAITGSTWGEDKQTLLDTYKAIGRPLIDYAAPVWAPSISDTKMRLQTVPSATYRDWLSLYDCPKPSTRRMQNTDCSRPLHLTHSPILDKVQKLLPSKSWQYKVRKYGQSKAG